MSEFQAAAHAFTTLPTGGFSPQARSVEPFAPASQWVIVLFMMLAGANFALHYRVLQRRINPFRDEEFRLLPRDPPRPRQRRAAPRAPARGHLLVRARRRSARRVFQIVSMMTTTGYGERRLRAVDSLTLLTARRGHADRRLRRLDRRRDQGRAAPADRQARCCGSSTRPFIARQSFRSASTGGSSTSGRSGRSSRSGSSTSGSSSSARSCSRSSPHGRTPA